MTIYEAPAPRQGSDDEAGVSPDSPETRLRELERAVAKLEERVEDLLRRMGERFEDFEGDVRTFAPLVKDVNTLQSDLGYVKDGMADLRSAVKELAISQQEEARKRQEGQAARAKETRVNRTLLIVAAIGLIGVFLESTAIVIAAVL